MKDGVVVGVFCKHLCCQPFLDDIFTEFIGVRLVIEGIKLKAEIMIGLGKAIIDPGVHGFPQIHRFLISGFPMLEHFLDLIFQVGIPVSLLRKAHIPFSDKVIPLFPCRLRGRSISPTLPGQHAFTYVNTTIID